MNDPSYRAPKQWASQRSVIPNISGIATFNNIGAFAQANPTAMLVISQGIAAVGVVGGAGALLAAIGPAGWFVLGIGGLAVAFAAVSGFKDKVFTDLKATTWGEWWQALKIPAASSPLG
jgi:hypothetical protein